MPNHFVLNASLSACCALALAACSADNAVQRQGQGEDPMLAHALAGPLMTDPDLVSRNKALSAISGGGPEVVILPLFESNEEAIAAAKSDADRLLGGKRAALPVAAEGNNPVLLEAVTAAQRAAAVGGPGSGCGASASYAMAWSLRLPQALPIYPRGHLIEAAGSDSGDCRLRVVRFVTPVDPGEVVSFYHARLRSAKPASQFRIFNNIQLLEGNSGGGAYAIQARKRDDGLTEVDLVSNGV